MTLSSAWVIEWDYLKITTNPNNNNKTQHRGGSGRVSILLTHKSELAILVNSSVSMIFLAQQNTATEMPCEESIFWGELECIPFHQVNSHLPSSVSLS